MNQLEPLTEQQLMSIFNLQQSSQQAEDALSQGMEALQQSLAETLANGNPGSSGSNGNVANYMGQMAMAMGKLGTLEGFLRQVKKRRSMISPFFFLFYICNVVHGSVYAVLNIVPVPHHHCSSVIFPRLKYNYSFDI